MFGWQINIQIVLVLKFFQRIYFRIVDNNMSSELSPFPKVKKADVKIEQIRITYSPSVENLVREAYQQINSKYANVHLFSSYDEEAIEDCRKNILLSKRTIKFIFLSPEAQDKTISGISWDKWYSYGKKSSVLNPVEPTQAIVIDQNMPVEKVIALSVKALHLDFIWLGVGCRLGAALPEFVKAVNQQQPYISCENRYITIFMNVLEQYLDKNPSDLDQQNIRKILQKCTERADTCLETMGRQYENLICSSYNERILIEGLTFHNYFKLLTTRNYFKLIWLQEPAMMRYRNFKQQMESQGRREMLKWLDKLENFLILDDYFYEVYQQKVAFEADFILNRGQPDIDFEDLIQKNHENIFRKFRPDFDEYFLTICQILKTRAGCIKEAVGSIIVKNKRILSTGYNGTPIGSKNCYNGGCRVCNNSSKIHTVVLSCDCIHAEYSCIIEAGIEATPGCTLYTTQFPCLWCSKVIIQAMISRVVYVQTQCPALLYNNERHAMAMFENAGVQLKKYDPRQGKFSLQ